MKSIGVSTKFLNKDNQYDWHQLFISSVLGDYYVYLDGKDATHCVGHVNLNPLGKGGDFVAFPVVGDIGFKIPSRQTAFFYDLKISNYRAPSNVLFQEDLNNPKYEGIFKNCKHISILNGAYKIVSLDTTVMVTENPSSNSNYS